MNLHKAISRILRPDRRVLVLFGVLLVPFVSCGLWHASFIVHFEFIYLYEMILGVGCAAWLGFYIIDWALQRYFLVESRLRSFPLAGMASFILCTVVEIPIHAGLQALSDNDGDKIRASIEEYHRHRGSYPEQLRDIPDNNLPQRTWTGSSFEYDMGLFPYRLRYLSIGGRERFYSHQYASWSFPFDD